MCHAHLLAPPTLAPPIPAVQVNRLAIGSRSYRSAQYAFLIEFAKLHKPLSSCREVAGLREPVVLTGTIADRLVQLLGESPCLCSVAV